MLVFDIWRHNMSASQQTRTEQHGNQVVHVRGDSDSDLEALFSVLHNKECKPPINSFKNRKLPASFFRPPEPKTCPHSGGSCHDPAPAYGCGQVHHGAIHGRSVSSPAQLPHSLGATSSQHSSQTAGITEGGGFSDDLLMQQWDAANKCQRYYLKWVFKMVNMSAHGISGMVRGQDYSVLVKFVSNLQIVIENHMLTVGRKHSYAMSQC